jgi:hypothetical protein
MHRHRPYYNGTEAHCASCGEFLWDVRTGARLDALIDADPIRVEAAKSRFHSDPELAYRLAHEDLGEVVATFKMSDRFHDYLMNPKARPDLQKPQHQNFLNKVKDTHLNPKTDVLMPWLTQEWKDGHIRLHPGGNGLQFQGHPDYDYEDKKGQNTNWHNLSESELAHWADWRNSGHPSIGDKDPDEIKTSELHKLIRRWETDLREKRFSVFMDEGEPGVCPTCGEPLEHGKCKLCDWATGPSNAMTDGEPIADQTKEVKPAIQSKVAKWDWDTETESYKDWPDKPSELTGLDHEQNGYKPLGDEFWGAGGCAHLGLAFKNVYPQMKLATGWNDNRGHKELSHTMAYDPESGRGFDSYGVHSDPHLSLSGEGRTVEMDSDPHEIAQHMGIPWDDGDKAWEDPQINEGGEFIEEHFLPGEWKAR